MEFEAQSLRSIHSKRAMIRSFRNSEYGRTNIKPLGQERSSFSTTNGNGAISELDLKELEVSNVEVDENEEFDDESDSAGDYGMSQNEMWPSWASIPGPYGLQFNILDESELDLEDTVVSLFESLGILDHFSIGSTAMR